jgi:hypothetical protein
MKRHQSKTRGKPQEHCVTNPHSHVRCNRVSQELQENPQILHLKLYQLWQCPLMYYQGSYLINLWEDLWFELRSPNSRFKVLSSTEFITMAAVEVYICVELHRAPHWPCTENSVGVIEPFWTRLHYTKITGLVEGQHIGSCLTLSCHWESVHRVCVLSG